MLSQLLSSNGFTGWGTSGIGAQGHPEKLAVQEGATVITGDTDSPRAIPTSEEGLWIIRYDKRGLPYWWNNATGQWIYYHDDNPPTGAMAATDFFNQPQDLPPQYQASQPALYAQPAMGYSAAGYHAPPTHQPWIVPPLVGTVPGTMPRTMPGTPSGVFPIVLVGKANDIGSESEERKGGSSDEGRHGGAVAPTKGTSKMKAGSTKAATKTASAPTAITEEGRVVTMKPLLWEKFYRVDGRVVWIHSVTGKRSKNDPYI